VVLLSYVDGELFLLEVMLIDEMVKMFCIFGEEVDGLCAMAFDRAKCFFELF